MSAGKDAEEDKGLWYLQHTRAKKGVDAAAAEILVRHHCLNRNFVVLRGILKQLFVERGMW